MKLLDYIRGARKGKEAHRLEKEAMRDPFLADALEGYSRVGNGADEQIEELRRRIRARAVRKRNHAVVWSIAASLLIGVCIGSYFLLKHGWQWNKRFIRNPCRYMRKRRKMSWLRW